VSAKYLLFFDMWCCTLDVVFTLYKVNSKFLSRVGIRLDVLMAAANLSIWYLFWYCHFYGGGGFDTFSTGLHSYM